MPPVKFFCMGTGNVFKAQLMYMLESERSIHIGASALMFLPQIYFFAVGLLPNKCSAASLFPLPQTCAHLCCREHLCLLQNPSNLSVTPIVLQPKTHPELISTLQTFVLSYATISPGKARQILYCVWLLILNLSPAASGCCPSSS